MMGHDHKKLSVSPYRSAYNEKLGETLIYMLNSTVDHLTKMSNLKPHKKI